MLYHCASVIDSIVVSIGLIKMSLGGVKVNPFCLSIKIMSCVRFFPLAMKGLCRCGEKQEFVDQ